MLRCKTCKSITLCDDCKEALRGCLLILLVCGSIVLFFVLKYVVIVLDLILFFAFSLALFRKELFVLALFRKNFFATLGSFFSSILRELFACSVLGKLFFAAFGNCTLS